MDRRRATSQLLILLLFLCAAPPSLAQPTNGTASHPRRTVGGFTPTTAIVLAVLIAALVLLTLFSIYVNSCVRPPPRRALRPSHDDQAAEAGQPPAGRRARGLDKELVESFPTAVYGDVKARVGAAAARSGPLECAVCLAEFEDSDELRVLPACCHVFHPACIDPWLAGATTCPLCRADLTAHPPSASPATVSGVLTTVRGETLPEEHEEACLVAASFAPEPSLAISLGATRSHEFQYRRTQSAMDAPDRHTLRLPEHVMKELAAVRCHRRAASVAGYPDAAEKTTPRWMASFWKSMSWQRQSRKEADAAGEEHGGSKRVVPITGAPAERPSGSDGSGEDEDEKPLSDDVLNRV